MPRQSGLYVDSIRYQRLSQIEATPTTDNSSPGDIGEKERYHKEAEMTLLYGKRVRRFLQDSRR
jgi:hypothetical protein